MIDGALMKVERDVPVALVWETVDPTPTESIQPDGDVGFHLN